MKKCKKVLWGIVTLMKIISKLLFFFVEHGKVGFYSNTDLCGYLNYIKFQGIREKFCFV